MNSFEHLSYRTNDDVSAKFLNVFHSSTYAVHTFIYNYIFIQPNELSVVIDVLFLQVFNALGHRCMHKELIYIYFSKNKQCH